MKSAWVTVNGAAAGSTEGGSAPAAGAGAPAGADGGADDPERWRWGNCQMVLKTGLDDVGGGGCSCGGGGGGVAAPAALAAAAATAAAAAAAAVAPVVGKECSDPDPDPDSAGGGGVCGCGNNRSHDLDRWYIADHPTQIGVGSGEPSTLHQYQCGPPRHDYRPCWRPVHSMLDIQAPNATITYCV